MGLGCLIAVFINVRGYATVVIAVLARQFVENLGSYGTRADWL